MPGSSFRRLCWAATSRRAIDRRIDLKTGQVIWRGLASGLTHTNGFDRTDNNIREAVNLIFSKYEYRADKY